MRTKTILPIIQEKSLERSATQDKVFEHTHMKKLKEGTKTTWIEPRAKTTYNTFKQYLEEFIQSQPTDDQGKPIQPSWKFIVSFVWQVVQYKKQHCAQKKFQISHKLPAESVGRFITLVTELAYFPLISVGKFILLFFFFRILIFPTDIDGKVHTFIFRIYIFHTDICGKVYTVFF